MFFLGIISWKGVSCFHVSMGREGGERGVCFSDGGGFILKWGGGGAPWGGASVFIEGVRKKS